jgi:anti-sigma B factor antagonist
MQMLDTLQDGVLILKPAERRLEARNAPDLRGLLFHWIEQGNERIVLDMSDVEFMDSSALSALIGAIKKMGPMGSIAVAGLRPALLRLFQLTRMDKVFPIHATVDGAVRKMNA